MLSQLRVHVNVPIPPRGGVKGGVLHLSQWCKGGHLHNKKKHFPISQDLLNALLPHLAQNQFLAKQKLV